jgi:hypothetical protein
MLGLTLLGCLHSRQMPQRLLYTLLALSDCSFPGCLLPPAHPWVWMLPLSGYMLNLITGLLQTLP